MDNFFDLDWVELFSLSVPLLEILIRGTAIYWFLFLIFRFVVRRDIGAVGIADILILVIVADASQNAMAGEGSSIADGMVLVSTLIGWNIVLDRLTYRFPFIRRIAEPSSLCLIKNGQMLKRNMRREFITEDELWQKLREQGVESLDQVKNMHLEPDGNFSVVKTGN
ncbi:MAG: hypothetical protein A3I66_22355 [Burkholderiales bacterium RIFCSPLOWO2_02_FULL_57_36]|nr:MAG: hypothetical protein A3I66_22355 [Burkholderiales bacterium RIFCSPLOWO2_02_FULL_57_36]